MARVLVQLVGEKIDIEDLRFALTTSDWKITTQDDQFYLSSNLLDSLKDNREIVSKANEFLDTINGAANIFFGKHNRVVAGNLKILGPNGSNYVLVTTPVHIRSRSRLRATLSVKGQVTPSKTVVEDWLEKSERSQSVRDVLHFFNDVTWFNLYKIYEVISEDVGGQKSLHKLIDKKELSKFTQAAQSRALLGDHARHASAKYKPPKVPLTLEEATQTITELFNNWIATK